MHQAPSNQARKTIFDTVNAAPHAARVRSQPSVPSAEDASSGARCISWDELQMLLLASDEESGRLDESMLKLADVYQDRARAAIATLTQCAGYAVWALVALIIAVILFRIVSQYAAGIQNLANPRRR